jgi:hypothetical protein
LNVTQDIVVNDTVVEQLTYGSVKTAASSVPSPAPVYSFTNGTSTGGTVAGVIDLWYDQANLTAVTLAPSASITYTLSALTDDAGRAVAYARIRRLQVFVTSKTAASNDALTLGGAASHAWTAAFSGTATVRDFWEVVDNSPAGLPVASGSNDQLKITNSGSNPITFFLRTSGCST